MDCRRKRPTLVEIIHPHINPAMFVTQYIINSGFNLSSRPVPVLARKVSIALEEMTCSHLCSSRVKIHRRYDRIRAGIDRSQPRCIGMLTASCASYHLAMSLRVLHLPCNDIYAIQRFAKAISSTPRMPNFCLQEPSLTTTFQCCIVHKVLHYPRSGSDRIHKIRCFHRAGAMRAHTTHLTHSAFVSSPHTTSHQTEVWSWLAG
ncbi:hypothetical protein BDW22DRAFT_1356394 [Trametopsis cervina]|nr:hypothetical protein BDW22DRAFT_1356394 [Trametopsis cervina]